MDTPEAFAQTDPVPITDMSHSFDPDQPIVVIDADTGERQLIWTELDSNASTPAETDLLIHFGKNLQDGHRYIVAMRGMKDSDGNPIDAPAGFQLFRDGIPTGIPAIENRRDHFEDVFDTLGDAGIARDDLYLAWDFTVASTENMTGRMLSMRDQAFADLGDTDLTDGGTAIGPVDGDSPQFTINPNDGDDDVDGPDGVVDFPDATTPNDHGAENIREVTGTVKVPCYMTDPDGDGGPLNAVRSGRRPEARRQRRSRSRTASTTLASPATSRARRSTRPPATSSRRCRTSMYGHGLFGDYTEVHTRDVRTLGTDHGVMTCATDFIGMSEDDVGPVAIPALARHVALQAAARPPPAGIPRLPLPGPGDDPSRRLRERSGVPVQRRSGHRHGQAALLLRQQPGRDRRRRPDRRRDRLHPLGPLRAGDELLDPADPQHRLRGLRH